MKPIRPGTEMPRTQPRRPLPPSPFGGLPPIQQAIQQGPLQIPSTLINPVRDGVDVSQLGSPRSSLPSYISTPVINPVNPGSYIDFGQIPKQGLPREPGTGISSTSIFGGTASSGGPDNLTLPNMSASINSSPTQSALSPIPSTSFLQPPMGGGFGQPMGGGFGQPMGGSFGQPMGGGGLKSVLDNYFSNFLTSYFQQNLK